MSIRLSKLSLVGLALVLALLLSVYGLVPQRAFAQSVSAAAPMSGATHFIDIAGPSNTFSNYTLLNNIATNNLPNANVFVTSNVTPFVVSHPSDPHPLGVWYDTAVNEWGIFNEDRANMPVGAAFDVLVIPNGGSGVFVQTATPASIVSNYTLINNPATNGNPFAQLIITPNWNPGGSGGLYNPHNVGVFYDTGLKEWAIFNEDLAKMPIGVSFNVIVGTSASGGTEFLQTVTSSNRSGDLTLINNPATNGTPNGVLFVTHNWNPGGIGGTYNPHPIGVSYDTGSGQWAIFNEDGASMPLSAAFNVLAFPF